MCDTVSHIRKLKPVQSHLAYKILYIDTLAFSNIFHSLLWFPSVLWKEFKMSHIYSLVSFIYYFCLFFVYIFFHSQVLNVFFNKCPSPHPLFFLDHHPLPLPNLQSPLSSLNIFSFVHFTHQSFFLETPTLLRHIWMWFRLPHRRWYFCLVNFKNSNFSVSSKNNHKLQFIKKVNNDLLEILYFIALNLFYFSFTVN